MRDCKSVPGRYAPMPVHDLAAVAALALGGFGGTLMMLAAYRAAPPIVVAPTQYSQIAWAALFGALFFAEPMTAGMGSRPARTDRSICNQPSPVSMRWRAVGSPGAARSRSTACN